ncbi:MAG TPA: F0F1 ATP synthase subunit B [Allosphingosinicella sp.]|jgi:F-type H+-transporting ATPase subunit b
MADPHAASSPEANLTAASTKGEHGAMPESGGSHGTAGTGADGGPPHAEPAALGLNATAWVALAMAVVIAIMLWKKVPAAIGRALDRKIEGIREQLDEAKRLRAEAEALRSEYEAKQAGAAAEAAALLDGARREADAIRVQAETDAASLIERRTRMAEDKIAAAERAALASVRAKAVDAAAAAAERLIRDRHDAGADRAMIDETIAGLGQAY